MCLPRHGDTEKKPVVVSTNTERNATNRKQAHNRMHEVVRAQETNKYLVGLDDNTLKTKLKNPC